MIYDGIRFRMWGLLLTFSIVGSSCSDHSIKQSNAPLTVEQATKLNLGIPFPKSATDIFYYLETSGLQGLKLLLRFHVDHNQSESAIEAIINENNRRMGRDLEFPKYTITTPSQGRPIASAPSLPAWWLPQYIRKGYMTTESKAFAPTIWYDANESIVYVYEVD